MICVTIAVFPKVDNVEAEVSLSLDGMDGSTSEELNKCGQPKPENR